MNADPQHWRLETVEREPEFSCILYLMYCTNLSVDRGLKVPDTFYSCFFLISLKLRAQGAVWARKRGGELFLLSTGNWSMSKIMTSPTRLVSLPAQTIMWNVYAAFAQTEKKSSTISDIKNKKTYLALAIPDVFSSSYTVCCFFGIKRHGKDMDLFSF